MMEPVFTIGHSTHAIEKFIGLLQAANVTVVSDVRSRPYSRMNPQYNREALRDTLATIGVKYVFLGKELGARSEDQSCYRNGQVQYDLLAKTELFKKGIERIKAGSQSYRIALMCAEKEPLDCHRTILVSRELVGQGLDIKHILADGQIETHKQALNRLVEKLRLLPGDMLRSDDMILKEAYEAQSEQIAYREVSEEVERQPFPKAEGIAGATR